MDVRIHINHQVLLDNDPLVAGFDGVFHPGGEVVTGNRVSNVDYPLLRQLEPLFLLR